jgi:hypothetical protein
MLHKHCGQVQVAQASGLEIPLCRTQHPKLAQPPGQGAGLNSAEGVGAGWAPVTPASDPVSAYPGPQDEVVCFLT